jgi:hypothetical protein
MKMNETGQNCEKKADRQIIEEYEQRCVNDSNCCRRWNQVSQKSLQVVASGQPKRRLHPRFNRTVIRNQAIDLPFVRDLFGLLSRTHCWLDRDDLPPSPVPPDISDR